MVARFLFRVDASIAMGSGHVMRCLTLARALRERGHQCLFVSREHPGHLNAYVQDQGFELYRLPMGQSQDHDLSHACWLGASQEEDAEACIPAVQTFRPDGLIVDHYALDSRWEKALRPFCRNVMVIDDLADRSHFSDFLLDQNLGREPGDYDDLIPKDCVRMLGTPYALLRPEFIEYREYSLRRRRNVSIEKILITMGGADKLNVTCRVLAALKDYQLLPEAQVVVVVGAQSRCLEAVKSFASEMKHDVEVLVNVSNMSKLMADCDLAIGAAGSTSWERCCLGVPSILVELAANQRDALSKLTEIGAAAQVSLDDIENDLADILLCSDLKKKFDAMSATASKVVDGLGAHRVCSVLLNGE